MYKFLRYYESTHPTRVAEEDDHEDDREHQFSIFDELGSLRPTFFG
jgi:hypothetical protein